MTEQGECLAWGRVDSYRTSLKISSLYSEDIIHDERDRTRILKVPTPIPGLDTALVTTGSEHSIAIPKDGKAYSWVFNIDYQTGMGLMMMSSVPHSLTILLSEGKG